MTFRKRKKTPKKLRQVQERRLRPLLPTVRRRNARENLRLRRSTVTPLLLPLLRLRMGLQLRSTMSPRRPKLLEPHERRVHQVMVSHRPRPCSLQAWITRPLMLSCRRCSPNSTLLEHTLLSVQSHDSWSRSSPRRVNRDSAEDSDSSLLLIRNHKFLHSRLWTDTRSLRSDHSLSRLQ